MNGIMELNRRKFLATVTGAVGALMLPLSALGRTAAESAPARHFGAGEPECCPMSREAFAACVGSEFRLNAGEGRLLRLKLREVQETAPQPGLEQFTLQFETSRARSITQGAYTFEHRRLGRFSLFITPGKSAGPVCTYHAAFCQLKG